jgi:hypothetical protein
VYSTCLFCNRSLGANEVVEHFPVGRRLAFDAAKGRLWAVCRSCGRWNLSPLDERWEAIEECERLFQDTRLRVSTDEIGLARVADSTELVRIGAPKRPEFAAWRYGDQFGKRRKLMMVRVGGGLAIGGALIATNGFGLVAGGSLFSASYLVFQIPTLLRDARRLNSTVARGIDVEGRPYVLRGKYLGRAVLGGRDGVPLLAFEHADGRGTLSGADALRVSALVLARLNSDGAAKAVVRGAVSEIEMAGGPEGLLAREAQSTEPRKSHWIERWQIGERTVAIGSLKSIPNVKRLALEMAVNEERERRALAGELALLAAEWKAAEEIAGIADDLLLPASVDAKLDAIRADQARERRPAGE